MLNTTTPDGYQVDENGAWTVDGIIQTNIIDIQIKEDRTNQSTDIVNTFKMTIEKPSEGFFWTVNINTNKYHSNPNVDNLLPENTRYYIGNEEILKQNKYSRCQKKGCY